MTERWGGRPFGLPHDRWPIDELGVTNFVAQFTHHPYRLDLGRSGRWLFIFVSLNLVRGHAVVIEAEELRMKESNTPTIVMDVPLTISSWSEDDDGFTETESRVLRSGGEVSDGLEDRQLVRCNGFYMGGNSALPNRPNFVPTGGAFLGQIQGQISIPFRPDGLALLRLADELRTSRSVGTMVYRDDEEVVIESEVMGQGVLAVWKTASGVVVTTQP